MGRHRAKYEIGRDARHCINRAEQGYECGTRQESLTVSTTACARVPEETRRGKIGNPKTETGSRQGNYHDNQGRLGEEYETT